MQETPVGVYIEPTTGVGVWMRACLRWVALGMGLLSATGCHGSGATPPSKPTGAGGIGTGSGTGGSGAGGSSSGGASGGDAGIPDLAPGVGQPIGPAGGTVSDPGGASVTVPQDALATTVMIGVTRVASSGPAPGEMIPLPAAVRAAGEAFALTPHGMSFERPVRVHVAFDATLAARAAGRPLQLYTAAAGGDWSVVPGGQVTADAVEASVDHFSFFVVGFELPQQSLPETRARKVDILELGYNARHGRAAVVDPGVAAAALCAGGLRLSAIASSVRSGSPLRSRQRRRNR